MFARPFTRGKFFTNVWGKCSCRKQYDHEKCESYSHMKISVFTLPTVYGRYILNLLAI